jgi:HD superfamily phosphohydrolase
MAGEGELGGLIAGDLDVDRMDYLVRDSHYTGVDIGVDLYRIVTALHPLPAGFAIDESAIAAAEMLLATRSMMYATVYYHPTCRAAEVMLERAIRLAAIEGLLAPGEFPRLDDVHVIAALRRSRGLAADLFDSLENRRLLKLAAAFSFGDLAPAPRRDGDLPWADSKRREAAEAAIAQAVGIDAAWVVVDAPELPPANAVDIQVQTSDGLSLLRERSTLVAGLPKGRLDHWRLRVYVPASVRVEAEPAARRAVRELFAS